MGSSSNHVVCLLNIESSSSRWDKSLQKLLNKYDVSFTVDKGSKTVYINGKFNPETVLGIISKAGLKANIAWCNNGRPGNRRDGHSYAMNGPPPNAFFNHHMMNHQQFYGPPMNQGYYPPPSMGPGNMMMNMQPSGFPIPFIPQYHPQPKPPLPYQNKPDGPSAKLFPPSPDPPKNFVMGDLQVGCIIM